MNALVNSGSKYHRCRPLGGSGDTYVISWTVDFKCGRIRCPRHYERITDEKGAERFKKKWNLKPHPEHSNVYW